jgi:serine O-acetyltransferase
VRVEFNGSSRTGSEKTYEFQMGMQIHASAWEEQSNASTIAGDSGRAVVSSGKEHDSLSDSTAASDRENGPQQQSLVHLIYLDYRRYCAAGARNALSVIALTQGFWASAAFRASHWALARCRIPVLRTLVKAGSLLLQKLIEVLTGICIPARCDIGPGLYIGHFGGIFVDSEARLGANCNIAQGVTIGKGGRGELHGVPVLGNRVHVGANAVILGKIAIGDDAVIGPGAVVMNSVPPRGVAMGNPARLVGDSGSFDFVHYDDMENDPSRKRQLQIQTEREASGARA